MKQCCLIPFLSKVNISQVNSSESNRDIWSKILKATEEYFWIAQRYASRKQVLKLKTYCKTQFSNSQVALLSQKKSVYMLFCFLHFFLLQSQCKSFISICCHCKLIQKVSATCGVQSPLFQDAGCSLV